MSTDSWKIMIAFLILGATLFFVSFLIKNKAGSHFKIPSNFLLLGGALFFSLGALEPTLSIGESYWKSGKPLSPAPELLAKYKANSYTLMQNSILYIAPPPSFIPPDFGKFRTFGYPFKTNALGFRERPFQLKKSAGKFRILVFGDSFTFGVGIDEAHRYTNILEEMLNLLAQDKRFEILNFGMAGYSTDQEHDLMRAILKIVDCDLVLVGFYHNDLSMTTQNILRQYTTLNIGRTPYPFTLNINGTEVPVYQNPQRNFSNIPEDEPGEFFSDKTWYKNSLVYRFLEQRTNININGKLPGPARWKYILNEIKGMKRLTEQYKLPVPVVVLLNHGNVDPNKNNFRTPKGEQAQYVRLYQFVGNELKQEGFHVVDTLPLFKKYSGMSMATSEWEFHPNYLGHYIYAKSIFDYLILNKLIDLRKPNAPQVKEGA